MDLLFKRYASPFLFINETIRTNRFSDFVTEIVEIMNEENEDKTLWEFYLHRVFEKSYAEFISSLNQTKESAKPVDFETAIAESFKILNGFKPE